MRVVGWLASVRKVGAISFVVVRDGWGIVQAVVGEAPGVELESVVEIVGTVVAEPQVELHDCSITSKHFGPGCRHTVALRSGSSGS